jgi:hypothetical protein
LVSFSTADYARHQSVLEFAQEVLGSRRIKSDIIRAVVTPHYETLLPRGPVLIVCYTPAWLPAILQCGPQGGRAHLGRSWDLPRGRVALAFQRDGRTLVAYVVAGMASGNGPWGQPPVLAWYAGPAPFFSVDMARADAMDLLDEELGRWITSKEAP